MRIRDATRLPFPFSRYPATWMPVDPVILGLSQSQLAGRLVRAGLLVQPRLADGADSSMFGAAG